MIPVMLAMVTALRGREADNASSALPTSAAVTYFLPYHAMSSHCHRCAFEGGRVQLFHHDGYAAFPAFSPLFAKSRHSSYFDRPELLYGTVVADSFRWSECDEVVTAPAYVVLVWTVQTNIGHLLLDVLEPLHNMMIAEFGRVRPDAVVYVDVAREWERTDLPAFLERERQRESPWNLLHNFTSDVRSADELRSHAGRVCFANLHVGLDYASTYLADGYTRDPAHAVILLADADSGGLKLAFSRFREFLHSGMALAGAGSAWRRRPGRPHTTFITRAGSRWFVNLPDLRAVASQFGTQSELAFEDLNFAQQLEQLQRTGILVGTYGTGTHNCVFMRDGAVLVLVLQQGWYGWKWLFANQALLSGVHVVAYQRADDEESGGFDGMHEGPWTNKNLHLDIDVPHFRGVMEAAARLYQSQYSVPQFEAVGPHTDLLVVHQELIRPGGGMAELHVQIVGPRNESALLQHAKQDLGAQIWGRDVDFDETMSLYMDWYIVFAIGDWIINQFQLKECRPTAPHLVPTQCSFPAVFSDFGELQLNCWVQRLGSGKKGVVAEPVTVTVVAAGTLIAIQFPKQAAQFAAVEHRGSPIKLALAWDVELGPVPPRMICLQFDDAREQCTGTEVAKTGQLHLPSVMQTGQHTLRVWYPGFTHRTALSEFTINNGAY